MEKIVISLTTYPERISGIPKVLDSIMTQTYKADKVVLYLSEEQFANREIPVDLSAYFEWGLEICWCGGDMKSHKKYLYAFQEYPDDYIITIDDDYYYEKHMIEEFVQNVSKFPACVLARRTHLITVDQNGIMSEYNKWWDRCSHYIEVPRMDLFAVGCGGILYPPHIITKEVFNINNIKKYCMSADDVWLKVMELISKVPVVQVSTKYLDRFDEIFANNGLYQKHNIKGGNDRSLCQLMEIYENFGDLKESLIERVFSMGITYENEIEEGRKKDNIKLTEKCIDGIGKDKDIVIYGAGTVAKRVYKALEHYKKADKIRAFVVEDTHRNVSAIKGIKVLQYKEADYKNAVCIIAISGLNEQYLIRNRLLALELKEEQIQLLNCWVLMGLQELADDRLW